ncbi:SGNH hydrolase [Gloeophyllum trabeum ATCC 11539]|uniref:SGNH hydrolase n=1 Tax=Gloeophyllum trabeum (strain ATCC 11539 / FP-39264 / Madison 617) TaxID=670483 RepID=S7Q0L6_GLOTA|nr:SGNH hydrolase [Gloeophyllum trabeum ATCC 11539]EPQ52997.1 SGNH hydrolase [Gloeophyllum trabeum ATCC 11539]
MALYRHLALLLTTLVAGLAIVLAAPVQPTILGGHWVETWVSMPQLTEYTNLPPPPFNQSGLVFPNSTLRQTLHMSVGGSQIRLQFSNAFGSVDLPITAVTVALPSNGSSGDSAIDTSTLQTVTFSGNQSIIVPDGSLVVSDPLNFAIAPQSTITVTMYLAEGQASNYITSHPGSRATSYFSFGNYVNAQNMTDPSTQSIAHWYFVSAVQTWAPSSTSVWAIVGDSITDGRGSDTDGNDRWPDLVLRRMQEDPLTANIAVINQAAGGNRILYDGLGPNAQGRIERDVLAQSGVKYAMIFEGVNDIGTADTTAAAQQLVGDRLLLAYQQIITRVHTFGIPIFAATITPFGAPNNTIQPYSDPTREATRQRVNAWIRGGPTGNASLFDAVVDFDAIVRDPANPAQLNPIYNSGDYLHPNVAGYTAIAEAFPLSLFTEFAFGVSSFN